MIMIYRSMSMPKIKMANMDFTFRVIFIEHFHLLRIDIQNACDICL